MLFVDCHKDFVNAGKLLAIVCPECGLKCRSDKALHQHAKEKHKKQFCHLCFEHRSLFISEMRLMTAAQLQAHMEASVSSSKSKVMKKSIRLHEEVAAGHQVSTLHE